MVVDYANLTEERLRYPTPATEAVQTRSVVLIDDCPDFRRIMQATCRGTAISLTTYASLEDMHSFALLQKYDLALIDFNLESFCGLEIAEYVDVFFQELPVILISGDLLKPTASWPDCVKFFISKSAGVNHIIQKSIRLLDRLDYYRKLRQRPSWT